MLTFAQHPLWHVPFIGTLLYADERRVLESKKIVDKYAFDIIKERITESDKSLASRSDILSLFVRAMRQDDRASATHTTDKSTNIVFRSKNLSRPVSEIIDYQMLRDVVMSFIIAGRDTTTCTITFMLLMMARNQEIQQKLQAEIDAIVDRSSSKGPAGRRVTSEDLKEMPYLHGCLFETLRLFPPVPLDGKYARNEDVLPSGARVLAGSVVQYDVYSMGRNAKVYPEPNVFKPERWIPFKNPSQYVSFLFFSSLNAVFGSFSLIVFCVSFLYLC